MAKTLTVDVMCYIRDCFLNSGLNFINLTDLSWTKKVKKVQDYMKINKKKFIITNKKIVQGYF